MATLYVPDGNGLRCPRHQVWFAKTSACADCVTDPGPRLEDVAEPLSPPPPGCLSTEEIERRIVEEADAVREMRVELVGKGKPGRRGKPAVVVRDLHHYNTICKLAETYGKLMRVASECAKRREDEEITSRRERRKIESERGVAN